MPSLVHDVMAATPNVGRVLESQEQETPETFDGSNHTLILGWSNKLSSLLTQLAIANQSMGGGVIVILANRERKQMELDIESEKIDLLGTKVIYSCGSPLDEAGLQKVSVSEARSIIVLAESDDADESDELARKIVQTILTSGDQGIWGHIVVELIDKENEAWVKQAGGELVETVVAHDVIDRLMVQFARQPGLAQVWQDILGFDNAEFYVKRWPELDGLRFGDVLISFPDAIPCGVKVMANDGKIVLNPDDEYILSEGDELLVVAEDDDSYAPSGSLPEIRKSSLPKSGSNLKVPKKVLFCGWRRDMDDMITVLESSLAPDSELWIFSEVPEHEREKRLMEKGVHAREFKNVKLIHCEGNAVNKKHLEHLPLETFDSILVVMDGDAPMDAEHSPLATLLLIRSIQSKRMPHSEAKAIQLRQGGSTKSTWIHEILHCPKQSIIINEILDAGTKDLLPEADYPLMHKTDDVMVSMALAMVAEDKQINGVLDELFADEGNEIYIRPADMYLDEDKEELSFYELMLRARQRQEIIIGYQSDRAVINPPQKEVQKNWSMDDSFIVLAQKA